MKTICTHCHQEQDVADDLSGQNTVCTACQQTFTVEQTKPCRHCGALNPSSAVKCVKCDKAILSIGIRKPGAIAQNNSEPAAPAPEPPKPTVKIGIRKPGVPSPAQESAPAPAAPETPSVPKIGLKRPAPVPEQNEPTVKINIPAETPAVPKIALKLPGKTSEPAAPAKAETPAAPAAPKIGLKLPGKTSEPAAPAKAETPAAPAAPAAPKIGLKLPDKPGESAAPAKAEAPAAPKLSMPGGAPKLNMQGGAPKLSTPGGAPKLNLPGKTSAPAAETKEETPAAPKEKKPVNIGKLVGIILGGIAALIVLLAGGGVAVWYFLNAPFGAEEQLAKGKSLYESGKKPEACAMLERASKQGNGEASYLLGKYYENGDGVRKDIQKALTYYEKAAVSNADAQFRLGCMYESGEGVEKDLEKAVSYYEKAKDQNPKAAYELARCYENGVGVAKSVEKAIPLRTKSAEAGDPQAMLSVAVWMQEGNHIDYDPVKAFEYLSAASEKGVARASLLAGEARRTGFGTEKDAEKALEFYKRAAEQAAEKPELPENILVAALSVQHLPDVDATKAIEALIALAKEKNPEAMYLVYKQMDLKTATDEGKDNASKLLQLSADADFVPAQYEYASVNGQAAKDYLEKAVTLGYLPAYVLSAQWLLRPDPAKALERCQYAADRGSAEATKMLADITAKGLCGVEKNMEKAIELYWKAATDKYRPSNSALKALEDLRTDKTCIEILVKLYEKAAGEGNTFAKQQLAWCYRNGVGVTKDTSKAADLYWETKLLSELNAMLDEKIEQKKILDLFTKGADEGNVDLQYLLGKFYLEGTVVEANPETAVSWLTKAADGGNSDAAFQVACFKYQDNNSELCGADPVLPGITKDRKQAAALFKKAAEAQLAAAQYRYAKCVLNDDGIGVEDKFAEASAWLAKASAQKYAPAMFLQVLTALQKPDSLTQKQKKDLREILKAAAEDGTYAPAMFAYAEVLRKSGDLKGAKTFYSKAANAKYAPAMIASGESTGKEPEIREASKKRYIPAVAEEGLALMKDKKYSAAIRRFETVLKKDYFAVYNNLGVSLAEESNGQKTRKAQENFTKARERGSAKAVFNLGYCFFIKNDNDMTENYKKAGELFLKAKEMDAHIKIPRAVSKQLDKIVKLELKYKDLVKADREDRSKADGQRVKVGDKLIIVDSTKEERDKAIALRKEMDEQRSEINKAMNALSSKLSWQTDSHFTNGFHEAAAKVKYPWRPFADVTILAMPVENAESQKTEPAAAPEQNEDSSEE